MRIALAQVPHPTSFAEGLAGVRKGIAAAAAAGARLVCFPECCVKGMRGTEFTVEALRALPGRHMIDPPWSRAPRAARRHWTGAEF